ncbi:AraC family transcriptional regulator [Lactobacillus sp.]|uniref:AraC family transcriptional regulator n=1 Tax=Lactobacillus sp. TaxID=1591 RepID=UPI003F067DC2
MAELEHELVKPTGNLPIWLMTFPLPDGETPSEIPPHWHQGIEISYTVAGSIDQFQIDAQTYQTSPGRIIVVNSQSVHSIETNQDGQALSMIYPYNFVSGLFPKISELEFAINDPGTFSKMQQAAYQLLQKKLGAIYDSWSRPEDDLREIKVCALSLEVLEILLEDFTIPRQLELGKKLFITQRMQEILDYIYDQYQTPIGLSEIAAHAHISKEYLARFFKKNMGITVAAFLRNLRARAARKLLLTDPGTLETIAEQCGFSGLRSMNRALVECYQESASEIRQKNSKNFRQ